MWNRGKDLDLTSPRAKTWKYRTVETGKIPPVSARVSAPSPKPTVGGRPAPTTVAAPAEDAEVLARLSTYGMIGVGGVAVALFAGLALFSEVFGDGGVVPLVIAAVVMHRFLIAAAVGGYNMAKRGGRAIWIEDGRLKAIDWSSGFVSVPLSELVEIRFEPAHRRNKTTEPALLLRRAGGKTAVVGLKAVDTPGPELVKRIRNAAPSSQA